MLGSQMHTIWSSGTEDPVGKFVTVIQASCHHYSLAILYLTTSLTYANLQQLSSASWRYGCSLNDTTSTIDASCM